MKKLISGLMVGLITATCAMTTMAAPQEHKKQPSMQHMNKKPMPPKHNVQQGSKQMNKGSHFSKNNQHLTHDKKSQHGFSNHNKKDGHKPQPMSPKQDHRR